MFNPITIPYGKVALINYVYLLPAYTVEDAEEAIGEMCNTVKEEYKDNGFVAGQVFMTTGEISDEGSMMKNHFNLREDRCIVIITYWDSVEQHEESHRHEVFKEKFGKLLDMCEDSYEFAHTMLWQGAPE